MKRGFEIDPFKEFHDFLNSNLPEVSVEAKKNIWQKVQKRIHPRVSVIFSKVLAIHLVVGFVSLSICHQFHMNPFHTHASLADLFIEIGGDSFCMAASGMLFLGVSLAAAAFILSPEELSALKRTKFQQALILSLISVGLFAAVGAEMAVGMSLVWILGALAGGTLITEAMWKLKYSVDLP